mmetsp:Transcript_31733/g.94282  ORF Transcript_31733/g.94282 Transcript_31733/m.94282 type:complete len:308 (-) Transcript_31733:139-1062(-)
MIGVLLLQAVLLRGPPGDLAEVRVLQPMLGVVRLLVGRLRGQVRVHGRPQGARPRQRGAARGARAARRPQGLRKAGVEHADVGLGPDLVDVLVHLRLGWRTSVAPRLAATGRPVLPLHEPRRRPGRRVREPVLEWHRPLDHGLAPWGRGRHDALMPPRAVGPEAGRIRGLVQLLDHPQLQLLVALPRCRRGSHDLLHPAAVQGVRALHALPLLEPVAGDVALVVHEVVVIAGMEQEHLVLPPVAEGVPRVAAELRGGLPVVAGAGHAAAVVVVLGRQLDVRRLPLLRRHWRLTPRRRQISAPRRPGG